MFEGIGRLAAKREAWRRWSTRLRWVPSPAWFALCWVAGRLLHAANPKLRSALRANMRVLLPEARPRQIRRWSRRYAVNVASVLFELLWYSDRLHRHRHRFKATGLEHLDRALAQGRGVVLHAAHCGNFFFAYWWLSQRYDMTTVATAYGNELSPLYAIFERELGLNGMDYDATPPLALVRSLKQHVRNNGVVLLFGDFYRPQFPDGRWFGKPSKAPQGAAMLAIEEGTPVVPIHFRHAGRFRHELTCEPAHDLSRMFRRSQRAEATAALNGLLERRIRQAPEQWLYWFNVHERWTVSAAEANRQDGIAKEDQLGHG